MSFSLCFQNAVEYDAPSENIHPIMSRALANLEYLFCRLFDRKRNRKKYTKENSARSKEYLYFLWEHWIGFSNQLEYTILFYWSQYFLPGLYWVENTNFRKCGSLVWWCFDSTYLDINCSPLCTKVRFINLIVVLISSLILKFQVAH